MTTIYKLQSNVYGLYLIGGAWKKRALSPRPLLRYRGVNHKTIFQFLGIFF